MLIFQAYPGFDYIEKFANKFPNEKLNIMISYAYIVNQMGHIERLRNAGKISLLALDSGTFTIKDINNKDEKKMKTYRHVTPESYLSWTSEFGHKFDLVFNFDDDHTGKDYKDNYYRLVDLKEAGVDAIPVIHNIESEELSFYLDKGYKMLSLGSAQIRKPEDLDVVFDKISKYSGIKIHLLGCTKFKFLTRRPLYSADSSSASQMGKKYGAVLWWNEERDPDEFGDKTDIVNFLRPEIINQRKRIDGIILDSYKYRRAFRDYLENLGINPDDLSCLDLVYSLQRIINLYYFKKLEDKVDQIYKKNGWIISRKLSVVK